MDGGKYSIDRTEYYNQLDLSPLQLTQNTTQYTCHYTATSPYLINPVIGMSLPHEVLIIGKYHRTVQ